MAQRSRSTSNKEIHTTDHKIGQEKEVNIPVDGDAIAEKDTSIEVVEGPQALSKAAELAFNEEKIKILVHESAETNPETIIYCSVNGVRQFFVRGKVQEVRRKYAEALARAKKTAYKQVVDKDVRGNVIQKMIPHTANTYPFSVIEDTNPNGAAWLQKILNEA